MKGNKKRSKEIKFEAKLDAGVLELKGRLTVREISAALVLIEKELAGYKDKAINIDLDGLDYIDSTAVVALRDLEDKYREVTPVVKIVASDEKIRKQFEVFGPELDKPPDADVEKASFFERLGASFFDLFNEHIAGYLQLVADITYWSFTDTFKKGNRRKGEYVNQAVLIGVNAVLIVGAMSFIIGLVLALQSAAQLRSFGVNIYIVDLTVIAMMSEMGPLITAIMVAGRSGSSIAAEIATMKVTSETDALRTMGLNPVRFVIVPKMHAALTTLPFLTIIADIMGIVGGMIIGATALGISPQVFIHRMEEAVVMKDIVFGIIKSLVFAYIIVTTGSYFGFRVQRGAEGVGKVTTMAVVVAISLVIVADSVMGLIFYK